MSINGLLPRDDKIKVEIRFDHMEQRKSQLTLDLGGIGTYMYLTGVALRLG